MKKNHKKLAGFTLIEVLITISIFTMIAYAVIALISNLYSNATQQGNLLTGSDQARKIGFNLANQLRNASYGADGSYSIGQAESQQLTIYSNADPLPDIEKIRYYVQNGKLYQGITKPSGGVYNPIDEKNYLILSDLANGASPVFYYYDGTYNGNTDNYLAQPVNITLIKFVKISLQIYKKTGLAGSNSTYLVTNGATVRNLKTNLGN